MDEYWTQIGTAVATIGVAYALVRKATKDAREDQRKDNERLRHETRAQVAQANGMPLQMLESSPHPEWAKGVDGRMRYINFAYEQAFGIRRDEYVGRLDIEVWDRETALTFSKHDSDVLREKRMIEFVEQVPINRLDPGGPKKLLIVQKFPIWNSSRTEIVEVGGKCWDADNINMLLRRAEAAGVLNNSGVPGKACISGACLKEDLE